MTRVEKWKHKAEECSQAKRKYELDMKNLKIDKAILEIKCKYLKDRLELDER